MKAIRLFYWSLFISLAVPAAAGARQGGANPDWIHRAIKQVTDVMVYDIYSPPVASRIYAYVTVAGYEAAAWGHPGYQSLAGQLNGLAPVPGPPPYKKHNPALAAVHAILVVGKTLVISEGTIGTFHQKLLQEIRKSGMADSVYRNSLSFGQAVAQHILAWSARDHYKETRSFPKYELAEEDATWKPTPPAYMRAVEPHWNKIRPFVLDSAQQFRPLPATPFSRDTGSAFYREAAAVYRAGRQLTPEQRAIAAFWDCNPFKMNLRGHVMYATKKISPGGHWINITRLACTKAGADAVRTAEAYAWVAITLADGFISCWDEKYRSNVIRPETYINQYIDPAWVPLLQTPPFPEYTSGHSVVSTAAAAVLTRLFGPRFSFADSTEIEFGLPVRHFRSFEAAAEEAAISRFYGGIHYMPSIRNGVTEGQQVAGCVLQRVRTRKEAATARTEAPLR